MVSYGHRPAQRAQRKGSPVGNSNLLAVIGTVPLVGVDNPLHYAVATPASTVTEDASLHVSVVKGRPGTGCNEKPPCVAERLLTQRNPLLRLQEMLFYLILLCYKLDR